jgi:cyclic pyranopterin phosphate synthase
MTCDVRALPSRTELIDGFGRKIDYLRVSVTDRCNFRCVYCMAEDVTFLPKRDVLSLDEMDRLCSTFVALGVRRLRLTGGEPLARRDVMGLVRGLSRHLDRGAVDEITLTTNGSLLADHARDLKAAGVNRVNISLDTLDPLTFQAITRRGDLLRVLEGIEAALAVGLKIKINAVAMRGVNEHHLVPLLLFAHGRGMDLTLIETMPIGMVDRDRTDLYLPLEEVIHRLSERFTLDEIDDRMAGPARYVRVRETGGRLGFVAPMTHNFCSTCNRVRVTCTGQLALCLGQDKLVDLRTPLRASEGDDLLRRTIGEAIAGKPMGHDFSYMQLGCPTVVRPMSATGG